jgi:sterol desaturase/sphingolipid hydroxylase (fatty acid hydroxylase superfamily)
MFVVLCVCHLSVDLNDATSGLTSILTKLLDGIYICVPALSPPGAAHHTDHHLYFSYNYGQFFTIWDRIGGSFRKPTALQGKGPLDQLLKMGKKVE